MAPKEGHFYKMHLEEITQRAWIFYNLNRDKAYARQRILQNLEWEFEYAPSDALVKQVDKIINSVYKS